METPQSDLGQIEIPQKWSSIRITRAGFQPLNPQALQGLQKTLGVYMILKPAEGIIFLCWRDSLNVDAVYAFIIQQVQEGATIAVDPQPSENIISDNPALQPNNTSGDFLS